jgi:hypothetical protein
LRNEPPAEGQNPQGKKEIQMQKTDKTEIPPATAMLLKRAAEKLAPNKRKESTDDQN